MSRPQSAAAFHEAMCGASSSYEKYANVRQETWKAKGFRPASARLGRADDYCRHYQTFLSPLLCGAMNSRLAESHDGVCRARFLDLGCAPGGLCQMLIGSERRAGTAVPASPPISSAEVERPVAVEWTGVGVTLDPQQGGLPMEFGSPQRLHIRFADVCQRESFVAACVPECERRTFDLVNLGIVLDHTVKTRRQGMKSAGAGEPSLQSADESPSSSVALSFGEQLYTQLLAAERALRNDGMGILMLALKTDFPSLPEVLPTLMVLCEACSDVRIIPTMYTLATAKKQFYVICFGMRLTDAVAGAIRRIWNLGTARYLALSRAAAEAKAAAADNKRPRSGNGEGREQDLGPTTTTSPGNGGGGDGRAPKVDSLEAVERNCAALLYHEYDALPTVSAVYATPHTGRDLDAFFDLVRRSLEGQREGRANVV